MEIRDKYNFSHMFSLGSILCAFGLMYLPVNFV